MALSVCDSQALTQSAFSLLIVLGKVGIISADTLRVMMWLYGLLFTYLQFRITPWRIPPYCMYSTV